ncbi:MAG: aminopeptidase P family protein [Bacteroidales bacterium]|nr:aminopeptidase P family protein [Bacteroidales bacterium]
MFEKSIYQARRDALKKDIGKGILLFLGNDESPMNYADNQYRFRQDSTFLYFFDFSKKASAAAIIDIDNNREIVFADDLTIDDIVWTGPLPTVKETAEAVGVRETMPLSKLSGYLTEALKQNRTVHYLPPYRAEHSLKLEALLNIKPEQQKERQSVEFVKAVVDLRNHKSAEEIEEIDKAAAISVQMHYNAMVAAQAGMKEHEVMAIVHKTALENGGFLSFPIICTTHGETLHNHSYDNTLKSGGMLLVDAGAELPSGYCGDISTTIPIGTHFSEEQRIIYDIVYKAHYAAVDALTPGTPFKEVYYLACRTIVEGLKGIGLMKGDAQEAVLAGAHALFFQCGLGHMMGLDVHDMENLGEIWVGYNGVPKSTLFGIKSLRLARELEPGFVLTIEPGIYFIPTLIDLWHSENKFSRFINYSEVEKWKNFGGLRNEEDYLITETGHRILGKYISRKAEDVEQLRQK